MNEQTKINEQDNMNEQIRWINKRYEYINNMNE